MPTRLLSLARAALFFCAALAASDDKPKSVSSLPSVHVDVRLVNVVFNVRDHKGNFVKDLNANDFEVREDGTAQQVKYFSAESEPPLDLALLVDTSHSQNRVLQREIDAARMFLHDILTPRDRALLVTFDSNVDLRQDFTSSLDDLLQALGNTTINGSQPTLRPPPQWTSTALYDAMESTAQRKLASVAGRKALMVLTDGQDFGSNAHFRETIEAVQRADTVVYVLLVADRAYYDSLGAPFYAGDSRMRKLTEETGGAVIDIGKDLRHLQPAFERIAAELRSQYTLAYTSSNRAQDGKFRKIAIHSHSGLKVKARRGYFAPRAIDQARVQPAP